MSSERLAQQLSIAPIAPPPAPHQTRLGRCPLNAPQPGRVSLSRAWRGANASLNRHLPRRSRFRLAVLFALRELRGRNSHDGIASPAALRLPGNHFAYLLLSATRFAIRCNGGAPLGTQYGDATAPACPRSAPSAKTSVPKRTGQSLSRARTRTEFSRSDTTKSMRMKLPPSRPITLYRSLGPWRHPS